MNEEDVGAFFLENEVPNWFSNLERWPWSSFNISLPSNWVESNFLGFVVFAVVDFEDYPCLIEQQSFRLLCRFSNDIYDTSCLGSWHCFPNSGPYCMIGAHHDNVDHDSMNFNIYHHFRWYVYDQDSNTPEPEDRGHEFGFIISFKMSCVDENHKPLKGCNIKECGVHPLYADQLGTIRENIVSGFKQREGKKDDQFDNSGIIGKYVRKYKLFFFSFLF